MWKTVFGLKKKKKKKTTSYKLMLPQDLDMFTILSVESEEVSKCLMLNFITVLLLVLTNFFLYGSRPSYLSGQC